MISPLGGVYCRVAMASARVVPVDGGLKLTLGTCTYSDERRDLKVKVLRYLHLIVGGSRVARDKGLSDEH